MKVIQNGIVYQLQPSTLGTFDKLPLGTYYVRNGMDMGFFLEKAPNFKVINEKVYGEQPDLIKKVHKTFDASERSIGVVLSGDKGIGKSLFARQLALETYKKNMPVIIVDTHYYGISAFLDKIKQECLILFDEFEKVFKREHQDELLGLFDGVSTQKRLYVVTSNSVAHMSEFLINRPGRFHYHIRFKYPTSAEVTEYLTDKGVENKEYIARINKISFFNPLNYDTLRAIAFELGQGYSLTESMSVLNILAPTDGFILQFTLFIGSYKFTESEWVRLDEDGTIDIDGYVGLTSNKSHVSVGIDDDYYGLNIIESSIKNDTALVEIDKSNVVVMLRKETPEAREVVAELKNELETKSVRLEIRRVPEKSLHLTI